MNDWLHLKEQELKRLDLLLHRQILRLRARYQLSLDEFRGLYISDQQVDELVGEHLRSSHADASLDDLTHQAEGLLQHIRLQRQSNPVWSHLQARFSLDVWAEDVLLLALAPELDSKYETLYAYLNNDVTRKLPSHELALSLFCETEAARREMRQALLPKSPLYASGLLRSLSPGEGPAWLSGGMAVSPTIVDYLLGVPLGGRLPPAVRLEAFTGETGVTDSLTGPLRHLPKLFADPASPPWLLFSGRPGSGRRQAARSLASALGIPLLQFPLAAAGAGAGLRQTLQLILLHQRLSGALLYLEGMEQLFGREGQPGEEARGLLAELQATGLPLCLACEAGAAWWKLLPMGNLLNFDFAEPETLEREALWRQAIEGRGLESSPESLRSVAERFVLNPLQIGDAVRWAAQIRLLRGGNGDGRLSESLLFEAARHCSSAHLGRLAVKVDQRHGWRDLVLPPAVMQQIEEVAAAIRHRRLVYQTWGMDQRFENGGGLKVLFSGISGTGKTMTASVLAGDLGLDLFRIDLSGIVSKYIGETEKNLDEIFRAAQATNAILFFDEADALFGKRSEVKDAHDRYANIEVAYLLQKMEEYDGVVILASNLSKNIDPAFSRRMHYVVEFPLPDETHRELLWRGMFPAGLPLDEDIDLAFLARQFRLAGGDIKNIVLSAAFLAASNGTQVGMQALLQATARQMIKQGKMPSANEFKQYYPLVQRPVAQTAKGA